MVKVINKNRGMFILILDFLIIILFRIYHILTFRWIPKKSNKEIKNILIINSGYLGDSILNIPLIKAVREKYKKASITMLVNPKFLDLWKGFKEADNIIMYDAPWLRYGMKISDWIEYLKTYPKFIKNIRKQKFDMAIDSRGDFRNNLLLLYNSGAKRRVGFGITGGSYFLTDKVRWKYQHEVKNSLEIAKHLKCKLKEKIPRLDVRKKDAEFIKELLKKYKIRPSEKKIIIAPGAGYSLKEWPIEKWIALVNKIVKKHKARIFLTGSPKDKKYSRIMDFVNKNNTINLIGKIKLGQSIALIKSSDLLISPDSGSGHIAAAVGTKTITLIGPTDPNRWMPYGEKNNHLLVKSKEKCSPCGLLYKCKYKKICMKKIYPKDVMKKIRC